MRSILSLLVGVAALAAPSGHRTVVLRDGRTAVVPFSNDGVDHVTTRAFAINLIQARYDTVDGWRQPCLVWHLQVSFARDFKGTLTFKAPVSQTIRAPEDLQRSQLVSHYGRSVDMIAYLDARPVDKDGGAYAYLDVYDPSLDDLAWLREPGDAFFPFAFDLAPAGGGAPQAYTDWAHVTEAEKRMALAHIQRGEAETRARTTRTLLRQPDGRDLALEALDGRILRYSGKNLQIDALEPVVLEARAAAAAGPLCWVLKGRTRGLAAATLEVRAPWFGASSLLTVKVSRKGDFAIPFGAIAQHPGLWTWLREAKETWVPIGVKVTPQPGAEPVETVEWCHLDAAAVRRLGQAAQAGR